MSQLIIKNVLKKKNANRTYFFGSVDSDKVKNITFVPVIENSPKTALVEDVTGGYQRPGSMPRMNKFKQFLKSHPDSLVPPVILSGRGKWKFIASKDNADIGDLKVEASAAILDGQHRLGGFVALYDSEKEVRNIDFLLIDNLSRNEEIAEFVIVNNTQVGVPKSLNMFIGQGIPELDGVGPNVDDDDVYVAWGLNVREDSPFVGRITRTKAGPEHLFALHSVAGQIGKMFSHGAFVDVERDDRLDIAIKYWQIIQEMHPREFDDTSKLGVRGQGRKSFEYKLLELTGFIAWSLIGQQILSKAYNPETKSMDWDEVEASVQTLSEKIEWSKGGEYRNATGAVGGPIIKRDMERVLAARN